ncbi:putative phage abortive infection protein [Mycoplasmatota bacterium WC44]
MGKIVMVLKKTINKLISIIGYVLLSLIMIISLILFMKGIINHFIFAVMFVIFYIVYSLYIVSVKTEYNKLFHFVKVFLEIVLYINLFIALGQVYLKVIVPSDMNILVKEILGICVILIPAYLQSIAVYIFKLTNTSAKNVESLNFNRIYTYLFMLIYLIYNYYKNTNPLVSETIWIILLIDNIIYMVIDKITTGKRKMNYAKLNKIEETVYKKNISLLVKILILIFALVYPVITYFVFNEFSFNFDIEIKSTVSSFDALASILSIVTVIILFLTYYNQRKQNRLEKFEYKFFTMMRLHRDNVEEMRVLNKEGRKIFVSMIREFRLIHKTLLDNINNAESIGNDDCNKKEIFDLTYRIFYFGIGPNSNRQLLHSLKCFLKEKKIINLSSEEIIEIFSTEWEKFKDETSYKRYGYKPFGGHQSRLGHYYRHIFRTIKYVNEFKFNIINNHQNRLNYMEIFRAQLSTHEQALLALNYMSFSEYDGVIDYIQKYQLIKNIPTSFFCKEEEIDLEVLFNKIRFE